MGLSHDLLDQRDGIIITMIIIIIIIIIMMMMMIMMKIPSFIIGKILAQKVIGVATSRRETSSTSVANKDLVCSEQIHLAVGTGPKLLASRLNVPGSYRMQVTLPPVIHLIHDTRHH